MGRAEFEENSFRGVLNQSRTIAETISESAGILSRLFAETEQEFSAVFAELKRLESSAQVKLASAQRARSECAKRIEECKRNYDCTEGGDEAAEAERDAHNAQVDNEIARLQQRYGELDAAVSALEEVVEAFNRMERKLSLSRGAFYEERARNDAEMRRSLSRGECFYHAVGDAYAKATEIINFREEALPVKWHGDTFKINRSGHDAKRNVQTGVYGFSDALFENAVFAQEDHTESVGKAEAVILETKSAEEFFARLAELGDAVSAIKIPSYDFHKIGGKETLGEMNRRGFEVKKAAA